MQVAAAAVEGDMAEYRIAAEGAAYSWCGLGTVDTELTLRIGELDTPKRQMEPS